MKLLLWGACGKMGHAVAALAKEQGDEIVCGVDPFPSPMGFPVFASPEALEEQFRGDAECAVDFSSAPSPEAALRFCAAHGIPLVLAATGQEDAPRLSEEYGKRIAVFRSENLSFGVHVLARLAEKAAALLKDADAEIVERHHNKKKDAPSGTALMLAERIERARGAKGRCCGRCGLSPRKEGEIGIHAVRGGNIVGEHELMFALQDELITLSHTALRRDVFASGALKAAHRIVLLPPGLYGMDDLLDDV